MRKIVAAINMTLDGICDHTAVSPDEELHQHYADLLERAGVLLYGRITYQLMDYWRTLAENPSGEKSLDDFARVMDKTPKVVFSRTLESVQWKSARLADRDLQEEVEELRKQPGKDIFIGSRSLINQLLRHNLIDEFQLCVHPVVAGGGLPLFEKGIDRRVFALTKTKTFHSGAVTLYYVPAALD